MKAPAGLSAKAGSPGTTLGDLMIDFANRNERCPYDPINGTSCPTIGSIAVKHAYQRALVCAEHVQRYTANGWTLVVPEED